MSSNARRSRSLRFRVMTDAEVDESMSQEPVPTYCRFCGDTGTVPDDPIFVNTEHSYGVEYRSDKPCPYCILGSAGQEETEP